MALELRNLTPFAAALLPWESKPGQPSLSVCVKGTFEIGRGEELAVAGGLQEPVHGEDLVTPSPRHASDVVPFKPRVDLLLVGSVQVEGASGAASAEATVRLGAFEKTVRAASAAVFRRAPLVYENAVASSPGGVVLQPKDPSHAPAFGPQGIRWPARILLNPEPAWRWADEVIAGRGWDAGPPPPGFDFGCFNAAPREQQLDLVRPGATLELEGLLPGRPVAQLRLPTARPQVFRVGSGRSTEVVLRCDTIFVDVDRGLVSLSWRGVATPVLPNEAGLLVALWDASGKKLRPDQALAALTGERVDRAGDPLAERHDRKVEDPDALPPPDTRALRALPPLGPRPAPPGRVVDAGAAPPPPLPSAGAPPRTEPPPPPRAAPTLLSPGAELRIPPPPKLQGEVLEEPSTAQDTKPIRRPPLPPHAAPPPPPTPPAPQPKPKDEITGEIQVHDPSRPAVPFATGSQEDGWTFDEGEITRGDQERPFDPESSTTQDVPGDSPLLPPRAGETRPAQAVQLTAAASLAALPLVPVAPPPPPPPPEASLFRPAAIIPSEPPPPEETPDDGQELELEACAALAARLAVKGADRAALLREARVAPERWTAEEKRWQAQIQEETGKGQSKLLRRWDEAYLAEQARLRGAAIELEEYAELVVASERGQALRALSARGLAMADMMRLQRVWTRRSAEDAKLAERIRKAVEAARSA